MKAFMEGLVESYAEQRCRICDDDTMVINGRKARDSSGRREATGKSPVL